MPLMVAIVSYALMMIARFLTNKKVKKYHQRIADQGLHEMKSSNDPDRMAKYFDHVAKSVSVNPPTGEIPIIYSTFFVIGLVGLTVAFFWGFVSIGWWGGMLVAGLFLLTGLVPSLLKPKR